VYRLVKDGLPACLSKGRSLFTQMFLTHIDADGNDSPPILIENATAANRAVDIPEFVNAEHGDMETMNAPATELYRLFNEGLAYQGKGQFEEAIATWHKVLELGPDSAKAQYNLGVTFASAGKYEDAIPWFRKALELRPDDPRTNSSLGMVLARTGHQEEALEHLRRAEEAIGHLERAVALKPDDPSAHYNLGSALLDYHGAVREALAQWSETLRLAPEFAPALNRTAWVLATCPEAPLRDGARAEEMAEQAVRLSGGHDPVFLNTLATAYARSNRFPEAVQTARQALELAAQRRDQPLTEALKARIALYEARKPVRDKQTTPPPRS